MKRMTQDTKLILFFIWVVIAMLISTGGLILIIRWYHREVNRVKKQQKTSQNTATSTTKQK
ncbi:hypothetical protein D0501_04210 [Leuconostoc holzapfelii]|uniref:Uncharacterized protein n=1 Tax=Leuconostoc holzapfelii TaxID=434464 RepID=A0ABT2NV98_9LACO|nr:hypothetical protein [Leuconostoc holzapfelii]MCT8389277.1 hypothetical protein [Leuconostoc holzapfelii]